MEQSISELNSNSASKTPFIPIIISVVLTSIIVGGGIFWWANQRQNELQNEIASLNNQLQQISVVPTITGSQPMSVSNPLTQSELNHIFELSKKEAETKIYYSDKLGVGFTYLSYTPSTPIKVIESGSKIEFIGRTVEVFTKDSNISLEQAIKDRFLQEYNPSDCFVKTYETSEQKLSNYISAEISFPPASDPDAPWWQNSDKCPQYYSQTNAAQYFLMNKDVPGKYLFVRVGQEPGASDGTPRATDGDFGWSHSIRILK